MDTFSSGHGVFCESWNDTSGMVCKPMFYYYLCQGSPVLLQVCLIRNGKLYRIVALQYQDCTTEVSKKFLNSYAKQELYPYINCFLLFNNASKWHSNLFSSHLTEARCSERFQQGLERLTVLLQAPLMFLRSPDSCFHSAHSLD